MKYEVEVTKIVQDKLRQLVTVDAANEKEARERAIVEAGQVAEWDYAYQVGGGDDFETAGLRVIAYEVGDAILTDYGSATVVDTCCDDEGQDVCIMVDGQAVWLGAESVTPLVVEKQ